jgi:rSAM/selenodomain-associated transferase 1
VANLAELPSLILRYTPDDASAELTTWLKRGWQLEPQESGDLGQRLARAFAHHFAQGAATVLILGSDCPYVERSDLTAATAALQAADVVIGPARDGGYWLIGLKEPHPELFQGVRWSSESVLDETRRRASEAGLHVELLRLLEDVDTLDAWERFEKGERARTIG